MNNRAGRPEGPENVDEAFAEIVADLRRNGVGVGWPSETETTAAENSAESTTPMTIPFDVQEDARPESYDPAEQDHYVPPEPPPLPRLRKPTIFALALIAIGIFLLVAPGLLHLGQGVSLPLALISLSCGIGMLILHARKGPPADEGWDDGARL
jgi:hypothetical protein